MESGGPVAAVVAVLLLLAGCGQFLGGEDPSESGAEVTPVPVPEGTPSTVEDANGRALAGPSERRDHWVGITAQNNGTGTQPWHRGPLPTCERSPGEVVRVQVTALRNNDRATNAGINTTWRFVAPTVRQRVGSYPSFVARINDRYRPLLNASAVSYGRLERDGGIATQHVTVTADGETTDYRWRVANVRTGQYRDCWMTTGIDVENGTRSPLTD